MKRVINIGSRDSRLALIQSEIIIEALKASYPEYDYNIIKIKTKGDKILNKTLSKVGGKGLFVKEIQQALLSEKIDLAVHSMKDLPGETPKDLVIGAMPKREDPRDVLILRKEKRLQDIPKGGLIGSSSLRRQSQILKQRRDLSIKGIRGNVQTRLRKMEEEEMDGIILAAAGLNRLGLSFDNFAHLNTEDFIPAVGQGALGCEIRREDRELKNMLKTIEDIPTTLAVQGERSFLKALNGGCHAPIACYGKIQDSKLILRGMVGEASGDLHLVEAISGAMEEGVRLGKELAKVLEARGARELLQREEEKEHASDRM
ncbi:hydroxymethylbilane synthase [Isachenkonia alkalipeptolytica]|uniref:Porphobilinogen deaminase n=1 Tax=Isachenkonia alkalipeptolytica TaxID=2565777 RepID=A0AA43XJM5_9CLOT|nr:hydroxymethylbilane synthase [Isachenkonia alkalipeptolytica]NBG87095.1 hydroxymethylbilane synthase [Isachenkonia alkalipeptolytica]